MQILSRTKAIDAEAHERIIMTSYPIDIKLLGSQNLGSGYFSYAVSFSQQMPDYIMNFAKDICKNTLRDKDSIKDEILTRISEELRSGRIGYCEETETYFKYPPEQLDGQKLKTPNIIKHSPHVQHEHDHECA